MELYQRKPERIRATQLVDGARLQECDSVRYMRDKYKTNGGVSWYLVQCGDGLPKAPSVDSGMWVVRDIYGKFHVYEDAEFQRMYEPV